jgi:hypothetical protein
MVEEGGGGGGGAKPYYGEEPGLLSIVQYSVVVGNSGSLDV